MRVHHCELGGVTRLNLSVKKYSIVLRTRQRDQLCVIMFVFVCMYVLKNVTSCIILIDAA